jgi:hypothetical protein
MIHEEPNSKLNEILLRDALHFHLISDTELELLLTIKDLLTVSDIADYIDTKDADQRDAIVGSVQARATSPELE